MIVIVMGVSGSGKSFLAGKLREATGWVFAEGDDYHPESNKARMKAGIPLTDADRAPWLDALHELMMGWHRDGLPGILTCSALKEEYRRRLTGGIQEARFVWLDPQREVLRDRVEHRPGHFMPPALLDSQLATLERPADMAHTYRLDGSEPVEEEISKILDWLDG